MRTVRRLSHLNETSSAVLCSPDTETTEALRVRGGEAAPAKLPSSVSRMMSRSSPRLKVCRMRVPHVRSDCMMSFPKACKSSWRPAWSPGRGSRFSPRLGRLRRARRCSTTQKFCFHTSPRSRCDSSTSGHARPDPVSRPACRWTGARLSIVIRPETVELKSHPGSDDRWKLARELT